jgi:glutathione peroxidase-family protein
LDIFCAGAQERDLYSIHFKSLDNAEISLSAYQGKQILVAEFDASRPDRQFLLSLDSLYQGHGGQLVVIVIPVQDFGTALSAGDLSALMKNIGVHYLVSESSYAQKAKGNMQHPLLRWVTDKNFNTHFDNDITQEGEIFLFNKKGRVYARFNKSIPGPVVQRIINREPVN